MNQSQLAAMTSMDGHREAIRSPDSQQAAAKASLVSPELSLPQFSLHYTH